MRVIVISQKNIFKIITALVLLLTIIIVPKWDFGELVETMTRSKKILPIYCVDTDEKKIAISFDAAWGNDDTDDLLAILKKHEVKATFFLVSNWIENYPEDVKKIYEDGHDIGNHSNTHPHMTNLARAEMVEEIMLPHKLIKELVGYEMELFRPPFGDYNDSVVKTAKECGYYTIQWDVDSLDWKEYGTQPLIDKVLKHKQLNNGSILLFHNNAKYTKDALDAIIGGLKDMGYKLVPISELIIRDEYYIDHTGRQFRTEKAQ